VSFGGALIAIGWLYLWLIQFPLRNGEAWAWWTFLISGITGFGSFLAYLGYGYLDSWHGVATLLLLPIHVAGLWINWRSLPRRSGPRALLKPAVNPSWRTQSGFGRALLIATAGGLTLGGLTIMIVGMTSVFVPQDLRYMGLSASELQAINPRLVPLIAHDRAGFGGGIATCGLILFFCIWCGRPVRHLWQVIVLSCTIGFASAIGIHPIIGYTEFSHLAPAYLGVLLFVCGAALSYRAMCRRVEIPLPEGLLTAVTEFDRPNRMP
jgi:hypothetical protein